MEIGGELPNANLAAQFSLTWLDKDPTWVGEAQAAAYKAALLAKVPPGAGVYFTTHIDDGVSRQVPNYWRAECIGPPGCISAAAAAAAASGPNSTSTNDTSTGAWAIWNRVCTAGFCLGGAPHPPAAAGMFPLRTPCRQCLPADSTAAAATSGAWCLQFLAVAACATTHRCTHCCHRMP